MKLSHHFNATRALCCVFLSATFVLNTTSAEAQFPSLKGINIPKIRTSSSSRAVEYLPQVIQAAQTLQRVQQQHQHQHYQPIQNSPVHKVNHPPNVCPQPTPPHAGQLPVSPPPASPNVPETKTSLARSLVPRAKQAFAVQDYDHAISILDQILKLVPEDADAYQFRSLAYFAKGEFESSAADAYDECVSAIHPVSHRSLEGEWRRTGDRQRVLSVIASSRMSQVRSPGPPVDS